MEPPNLDKTVSTELTNFPTETVINTANQIFPDTIVSNNASIPEEIMEEDVPNVRILTRGFAQRVSLGIPLTIPKLKRGTLSEKKSSSIRTQHTAIPVHLLPFIYDKVMQQLPEAQTYNAGKLQHFIVESAREKERFPKGSEEKLVLYVLERVRSDESFKGASRFDATAVSEKVPVSDEQRQILHLYDEYMNSEKEKKKRSFRNDSRRHKWTEDDLAKFKCAFEKYGNGPKSNRKIAESIGNGVHPNHVAYLKLQFRRKKNMMEKGNVGALFEDEGEEANDGAYT